MYQGSISAVGSLKFKSSAAAEGRSRGVTVGESFAGAYPLVDGGSLARHLRS